MKIAITFQSVVEIEGESIEEIGKKWEEMELYADVSKYNAEIEYCDEIEAYRVDDESYDRIDWTTNTQEKD